MYTVPIYDSPSSVKSVPFHPLHHDLSSLYYRMIIRPMPIMILPYNFIVSMIIISIMHLVSIILEKRVFPVETFLQNLHCCLYVHHCLI